MRPLCCSLPIAFLFLLLSSGVASQKLPPRLTAFGTEDYQAHHQVFCIEPFEDGRVAFGTIEELLIHDGESFRHLEAGPDKGVLSMDRGEEGHLYIGGSSLMAELHSDSSGRWKMRSLIPLLPDSLKDFGNIWDTWAGPNGGVYFNAYEKLFYYDGGGSLKVIPSDQRFHGLRAPAVDEPVIQDLGKGLFSLDEGEEEFLKGTGKLSQGVFVRAVLPLPGAKEEVWTVFTRKNGVFKYFPSKEELIPFSLGKGEKRGKGPLEGKVIYSACSLDPTRNPYRAAFAIGTINDGIHLLSKEGELVRQIGVQEGVPAELIWDLRTDPWGNLWAATDRGIVRVHLASPFTLIEGADHFHGGVNEIERAPDPFEKEGECPLFLATQQGLWWFDPQADAFSRVKGSKGHFGGLLSVSPSEEESESAKFLAAGMNKLFELSQGNGEASQPLITDTALKRHVYDLASFPVDTGRGKEKMIVASGREGIFFLDPSSREGSSWKLEHAIEDIPEAVHSVGWDPLRSEPDSIRIWGGMRSKGLVSMIMDRELNGFRMVRYDTTDGLPPGLVEVFEDPDGQGVVFGTTQGLYEPEASSLRPCCRFGKRFCKTEREIYRMKKGPDGTIWIKDDRGEGVKHLKLGEDAYRIDSLVFQELDWGTVRAFHPEEGRTWMGAEQGLACYHPGVEKKLDGDWSCLIRKVRGSDDSLLFGGVLAGRGRKETSESSSTKTGAGKNGSGILTLPYERNRISFRYAAAYPDHQEQVRYRYKLEGYDTTWDRWKKEANKEYTNLPEGSYRFRVQAINIYGNTSEEDRFRFRILPPWYRTWIAYGGYTVAGVGFIWLLIWLYSRRLMAQKERLERIVDERTKEIRQQKEVVENQKGEIEEAHGKLQKAHEEITQSIDYAQKIQYALLQSEEQVSPQVLDHFILFKPQSQVSGDFYWMKEHKGHFYIAAVDCTGHGVPGAFMSMLGISQLNEIMNTDEEPKPGEILTELRERVVRELSGSDPESAAKDGMDAAIVKIPIPKSQTPSEEEIEVEFAGAQNPLYVIRKGIAEEPPSVSMEYQGEEAEGHVGSDHDPSPIKPFKKSSDGIEIKGDGQPVGYDEYAKDAFTTVKLQLRKEDVCYFFSDGYADQFGGPKGKKFRYGPFKELLTGLHEKPLEEQKQDLDRSFEDWKDESKQEQIDDVVVIGVRL